MAITPISLTLRNVKGSAITATENDANLTALKNASEELDAQKEPADATILKDADIGVSIQSYDVNTTIAGNTFNGISELVQLDGTGKLPAIDGSQLTNLSSGFSDPMTTIGDIIYRDATNTTTRLPVGTTGQVLGTADGVNLSFITPAGGGDALVANPLSQFASTTSAELAGVISDETGSGSLVFGTSPTLVTPSIGVATGTSFNSITALSSTNPLVAGTVAVGTSTAVAREDHVHPAQTDITGNAGTVTNGVYTTGSTMTGALTALAETKVAMAANDIDLSAGNLFTKTITGATTLTVSNWLSSGNANSFILELTDGGSAAITWFSGVKWAGGTAPTLTAAGVDILGFYSHDGGTTVRGILLSKDSK